MLGGTSLPIVCTTNRVDLTWLVHLKTLSDHPYLSEDEKLLWLWLATKVINNPTFSCSYSYEQISQAINRSEKQVHRSLFRLRIMGFLKSDIPIWYGTPTREMAETIKLLKLTLPDKADVRYGGRIPSGI